MGIQCMTWEIYSLFCWQCNNLQHSIYGHNLTDVFNSSCEPVIYQLCPLGYSSFSPLWSKNPFHIASSFKFRQSVMPLQMRFIFSIIVIYVTKYHCKLYSTTKKPCTWMLANAGLHPARLLSRGFSSILLLRAFELLARSFIALASWMSLSLGL